jgi:integrase
MFNIMKTNFSLLFYLKKPKNYSAGAVPIYLRITVNGMRAELTAGRDCSPNIWNVATGRAKGIKEDVKTLNAYLDNLQSQIYEAHYQQTVAGLPITANDLKNRLLGKSEKIRMLVEIFEDHNKKIAALINRDYAAGTVGRYEIAKRHVENYIRWKYKTTDIDIRKVDHDFVTNFDHYLRSVRKCANNSAVKYIKNFGKIIRICLASGWLEKDPFINYKARVKRLDRPFLSQDELNSISNKILKNDRLSLVKDIFLFSCYTGLAYADVSKLKRNEIVKGTDGEMWIHTKRRKTDTVSHIPILPSAMGIIKKYLDHPICLNDNLVLPVPSNQKVNEYLKEIAAICDIDKPLTFHIARHTFATTVTLANGVPIESVSKMLGHTDIKTTQHYAKILDSKVSKDMASLKLKYSSI